ncbi:putative tyrosine carboxypeptidase MATCAP2 [Gadus macrocephalus]|uniref:putative tyrosine carboxypeptidase MATCAP2 n=1 Tax=Gadus macrocephalus TaxID=80720 RepID=UPI0028CBC0AC|nr:putative tyrosine carboxypeptidase MATCAP2 [Gadus macrocephalus]XP_059898606.1 putative tyrosine carboxypeptidase MATCAP2 [Gadus macrocephalus]
MLGPIRVTELLRWPQRDMSKQSFLKPRPEVLSPSQVCLEKLRPSAPSSTPHPSTPGSVPHPSTPGSVPHPSTPSSVLQELLTSGSSSYNVLLQAEEAELRGVEERLGGGGGTPKRSPSRRRRLGTSAKSASSAPQRKKRPSGAPAPLVTGAGGCAGSGGPPAATKPARGAIAVRGSAMGLSQRPAARPREKAQARPGSTPPPPPQPRAGAALRVDGGRKLCILAAIKPSNVEKEKLKFFKSDFTYNPQFEYSNPVSPLVLARHSQASDRFLTQAVRILELALNKYGSYENFEQATGGSLLSRGRIGANVRRYLEKEGCVGQIVVHVTEDLLSRASMTVVSGRPTLTINLCTAREHWLEGMLRHEIGTHYLRSLNNSQQPWSGSAGRRRHGLRPPNPTEEGLASLHSVLLRRDPTLWRAALLYVTVQMAARASFAQLFSGLARFLRDPHTRWAYCVRAKRGQTDTAQPGCFSKDQVYLEGILNILRHREQIDFPMLMALGKVSFEDVERLRAAGRTEKVRIPHFLQDRAAYAQRLEKIMEVNQLSDPELRLIV